MNLWKHKLWKDVAFRIFAETVEGDNKVMTVDWYNTGKCHEPWPMGCTQRIKIPIKKWNKEYEAYEREEVR